MTSPTPRIQPGPAIQPRQALATLWQSCALDTGALDDIGFEGRAESCLPSSFAVATALQASLGAAALAAAVLHRERGGPGQQVSVAADDVARECQCAFTLDGRALNPWEKYSGLYPAGAAVGAPGHVRIHANFAHHRDGALRLLGLPAGTEAPREALAEALRHWHPQAFEQAAADAGLVVAMARHFEQWDAHPQALAMAALPVVDLLRLDDADARPWTGAGDRPLRGLRVLDLTRILAGPVACRTLAAYGADVLLVNGPGLPNIDAIAETSRGKLSTLIDLATPGGRETLRGLVREADVLVQAYRPGALAALGFDAAALAALRPGLVCVDLSAYGEQGPWAGRRGFDSLVQTATGFNLAEAQAFGQDVPRALPLQALDYAAGFLVAFGVQAALLRQAREGGSWRVGVTLAGTGRWLRSLGRLQGFESGALPDPAQALVEQASGFGRLRAVPHAARFSLTPAYWDRPSMPPGSHPPAWPGR